VRANDEPRQILYVGSSNGKLFALNTDSGRRRWSFDTTPNDPALRDRAVRRDRVRAGPELRA
jgi:outer membrane protein assembly factor BamB